MYEDRPWLVWVLGAVLLTAGGYWGWRLLSSGSNGFSSETLAEDVTIKYTDTGKTAVIMRGSVVRELSARKLPIDPSVGLRNPETNKNTGFPENEALWKQIISEVEQFKKARGR